jgi:hypothetical protein
MLVIENVEEFKKLVMNVLAEDLWSTHAIVGTITSITGNLYSIQPRNPNLPAIQDAYIIGLGSYTNVVVGSNVVCIFDEDGECYIVGTADTITAEQIPLTSLLINLLTTQATIFDTHTHISAASGSPTNVPTPNVTLGTMVDQVSSAQISSTSVLIKG